MSGWHIEKIFKVFQCLAAYVCGNVAEMGWSTIKATYADIDDDIARDTFKRAFFMQWWIVSIRSSIDETDKNIQFEGERKKIQTHVILALKATHLMKGGCEGYIVFMPRINIPKWWRKYRWYVNSQTYFWRKFWAYNLWHRFHNWAHSGNDSHLQSSIQHGPGIVKRTEGAVARTFK